jgi:ribosomal protein L6P/L9E
MSRVGLKPISLPEKVAVKLDGRTVVVEGPKGKLDFNLPDGISLKTKTATSSFPAPPKPASTAPSTAPPAACPEHDHRRLPGLRQGS